MPSTPTSQQSTEQRIEAARALLDKRCDKAALRILRDVTAVDPQNARGWQQLARALTFAPRTFEAAEAALDRAQALEPDMPAAFATRGFIANMRGQHELALQHFDRALSGAPNDVRTRINRSSSYAELGQHTAAWEDACAAMALAPKDPLVYYNYGWIMWRSDRRQALEAYWVAFKLMPRPAMLADVMNALQNAYPALKLTIYAPIVLIVASLWVANPAPLAWAALAYSLALFLFEIVVYLDRLLLRWASNLRRLTSMLIYLVVTGFTAINVVPDLYMAFLTLVIRYGPEWLIRWLFGAIV
jgi:Tfp pilus assembly protein PilF